MEYIRLDVGTTEFIDMSEEVGIGGYCSIVTPADSKIFEYIDIYDMGAGTFEIYGLKATPGAMSIGFEIVHPDGTSRIIEYSIYVEGVDKPIVEPDVTMYVKTNAGWKEAEVCTKKVQGFMLLESKLKEQRSWK